MSSQSADPNVDQKERSGKNMKNRTPLVITLIILTVLIMLFPLFLIRGAEFEGSDGAGSEMVDEVSGGEYEPWFDPILETLIGGELPSEMETLFFCIQTGIGVGVIAYCFGYLVARKRYNTSEKTYADELQPSV
ncbi:MAG: cobalt transport protein CbiN [Coriobacteriales bacterium]|jgi:cobalt/nickel transport protein|nr:cobalt transport protein CbiN [Coriobacteriales bacterium]